ASRNRPARPGSVTGETTGQGRTENRLFLLVCSVRCPKRNQINPATEAKRTERVLQSRKKEMTMSSSRSSRRWHLTALLVGLTLLCGQVQAEGGKGGQQGGQKAGGI